MIGRLHFALSLIISYFIYLYLGLNNFYSIILSIITAKLSSLPDFDYKIYSWANKNKIYMEKTRLKYPLFPIYILLALLTKIFKHRGITHSIFPIVIFFYLSFFMRIFLIFAIAFTLHILEDMFTISGIYPLYPIKDIKIKIPLLSNSQKKLQTYLAYIFIFIYILLIL